MIVSGWHNGSPNDLTGSGYGIKISKNDRDIYFKRNWHSIKLELDDGFVISVNLTNSFWNQCIELRSKYIGRYLIKHGLAPWEKYKSPKLKLVYNNSKRIFCLSN